MGRLRNGKGPTSGAWQVSTGDPQAPQAPPSPTFLTASQMSSPQGPRHRARGDCDEWPFVSPRLPYCLPLQHLAGLAERRTPPGSSPHSPRPPPATRPAPARDPHGGRRGARPRRGRRTQALRLEGGGKVAASPPPRLPGARGAFLRSDPRRAAKGAAGEKCCSPESESDLPPSARVFWVAPVDLNLRPKACGWAASRAAGRDQGTFGRQKAEVLGSASFQGLENRREWRRK